MANCWNNNTKFDYKGIPLPATVVIVLPNIMGNVVTIIVIVKTKSLHKFCNFLLVNLAFSDIMVGLIELIRKSYFEGILASSKDIMAALQKSGNIQVFLFPMLQVSLLTITFIAFDRYLAVAKPFHIMKKGRIKHLKLIIPCIWVVGFLLTIPIFLTFIDNVDPAVDRKREMPIMGAVHFVSSYLLPLFVLVWTYIRILWILKNRQLRVGFSNNQHTTLRAQQRASKLLGAVIIVHNMCFFPYAFITFVVSQPFSCKLIKEPFSYFIARYILQLSPVLNPLIYFFHSQVFRGACNAIFIRIRRK